MSRIILTMAGIALAATNVGWLGERHRHAETRAAYSDLKESNVEAQRLALVNLRARENAHAEAVQAITKRGENEKRRIAADLRIALDGLRNRPDRSPDAVPGGAENTVGCTGAGLARQDAEFLAGYAAAAAELANALGECRAAYDAAVRLTAPVLH
jgi:hypothetical protein